MMDMIPPETLGASAVEFAGVRYQADANGVISVPASLAVSLRAAGWTDAAIPLAVTAAQGYAADAAATVIGPALLPIQLQDITMEDGTALTKQATTVAGFAQLDNKDEVILIPAGCTSGEALAFSTAIPEDLDETADVTVHVTAGKGTNTDSLTLDCEAYFAKPGDVDNADAQTTAATAITLAVGEIVFTCPFAGILGAPGSVSVVLTLGGTNTNDAVNIFGVWIEYTRKVVA